MQKTKQQKRIELGLERKIYRATILKIGRRRDIILIISIAELLVIGFLVYLLVKG